jgi:hypothetical protein
MMLLWADEWDGRAVEKQQCQWQRLTCLDAELKLLMQLAYQQSLLEFDDWLWHDH